MIVWASLVPITAACSSNRGMETNYSVATLVFVATILHSTVSCLTNRRKATAGIRFHWHQQICGALYPQVSGLMICSTWELQLVQLEETTLASAAIL